MKIINLTESTQLLDPNGNTWNKYLIPKISQKLASYLINPTAAIVTNTSNAITTALTTTATAARHIGYKGIIENAMRNTYGAVSGTRKDKFSRTKKGRDRGKNKGGKGFGRLLGGITGAGGMIAGVPKTILHRGFETTTNYIDDFIKSTSYAGVASISQLKEATYFSQRSTDRITSGKIKIKSEISDRRSTLKKQVNKITAIDEHKQSETVIKTTDNKKTESEKDAKIIELKKLFEQEKAEHEKTKAKIVDIKIKKETKKDSTDKEELEEAA